MFENIFFIFSFNQVDLQNMMDPQRKKKSHQSKFVKQFCYYTIVFILQIRRVEILISIDNYLDQLDSDDSGDDSCDGQGWKGHHFGKHCRRNLHLHIVPCLHNAWSWLGCLRSRTDLQPHLLCPTSFSGLSILQ